LIASIINNYLSHQSTEPIESIVLQGNNVATIRYVFSLNEDEDEDEDEDEAKAARYEGKIQGWKRHGLGQLYYSNGMCSTGFGQMM